MKICPNPRTTDLAVVAKQMADIYPESFMDHIGTDLIAGGHNDLLYCLCERRDNVCPVSHVTVVKRKQSKIPKSKGKESQRTVMNVSVGSHSFLIT